MIKIRKFIFEDEDLQVVQHFLDWLADNFYDNCDFDFLTDDSGLDMPTVQYEMEHLLHYMERNREGN